MNRKLASKVALVIVGLLFIALGYPMVLYMRAEPAVSMMLSLYVTLGLFLLLAVRDPSAHRSLILFTAWSSLVHAAVMGYQAVLGMVAHGELIGVAVLIAIGVVLLVLVAAKDGARRLAAQAPPTTSRS